VETPAIMAISFIVTFSDFTIPGFLSDAENHIDTV